MDFFSDMLRNIYLKNPGITDAELWVALCNGYNEKNPLIRLLRTFLTCCPDYLSNFDSDLRKKLAIEPYGSYLVRDEMLRRLLPRKE